MKKGTTRRHALHIFIQLYPFFIVFAIFRQQKCGVILINRNYYEHFYNFHHYTNIFLSYFVSSIAFGKLSFDYFMFLVLIFG
jgi:hypothetical protein